MTPRAVIFDCDGVVVDSEGMTFELLVGEFASHDLLLPVEVIARDFIGGTMADVAHRARKAGATLPDTWVDDFYQRLYTRLAKGTPMIPGILGVLDALDTADIPFAIGSNGSDQKMQITLGQHPGLIARFRGHLYSGQTLGAPKPAPDLYLHAAGQLGVAPTDCVVIEDSPTGARAASAAGMRCMGFAAHTPAERLTAVGAEPFFDMNDLPRLLGL
ncbi:MAG: HAD-IA family hydrolase [Pseudotabrizicola sp.]|uniref:HAD family hydrolase n=1 Tax=Pseudotabrizicola sp. TaxID=2939647 RepID=UPI00272F491B|nr:HAD-IA family hydrolase [Pseudotabrizicola sp.]MDP2082279.1 HAD-IA family hydrolase [Pseudotabrizicola sp.]MDZ7575199.1 HAD-IA family hydrolase [Pseudotabrizicola sp.]